MRRCRTAVALLAVTAVMAAKVAPTRAAPEAADRPATAAEAKRTMQVGDAIKLPAAVPWASSDAKVGVAYGNGMAVALSSGTVTFRPSRGSAAAAVTVTVRPSGSELASLSALKQFPDNRTFSGSDGRKCVGSELNAHMPGNTQEERVDRNRVLDPHPANQDDPLDWEVQPETPAVDGAGVVMGTVAPTLTVNGRRVPGTKINYGVTKVIHGRFCVYAFATHIYPTPEVRAVMTHNTRGRDTAGQKLEAKQTVATSAWIPLDGVVKKESLLELVGVGRGKLPKLPLDAKKYVMTGGTPAAAAAYLTPDGVELSIVPRVKADGPQPSDYLRRPSGTINVLYCVPGFSIGGQSLDSVLVTSKAVFRRATGVREFVMPTYYPVGHPQAGKVAQPTMTFWYGAVEAPNAEVIYGWVAREALQAAT